MNDFLRLLGHTAMVRGLAKQQLPQAQQPQPAVAAAMAELNTDTTAGSDTQLDAADAPGSHSSGSPAGPRLHILDCGCGSSHLSFGERAMGGSPQRLAHARSRAPLAPAAALAPRFTPLTPWQWSPTWNLPM